MGRYVERAEHTARLLSVHLTLMLDQYPSTAQLRWQRMVNALFLEDEDVPSLDPEALARALTTDDLYPASIRACISNARENARQIRDRISTEMWEQLNILYFQSKDTNIAGAWHDASTEFLERIDVGTHLFEGTARSTISHDEGFHFMELGRYIERAMMTISLLDSYREFYQTITDEELRPGSDLDLVALLKCATAFEAYCRTHTADLRKRRILDFLLLNADFPHSVRFSVDRIAESLQAIGSHYPNRDTGVTDRLAGRLRAELSYSDIDEIFESGIDTYLAGIRSQCERIHGATYDVFIHYPIERELAGAGYMGNSQARAFLQQE